MRSTITRLFLVTLIISALIFLAALVTADKTRFNNSFVRIFPPHAADPDKTYSTEKNVSIVGYSNHTVYLWSGENLTALSFDMLDTCNVQMEIEPTYNPTITDSYFYLQNGKVLKQGDNKTWMVKRSDENLPGFTAMQPISKKTAVLRVIDINARKNLLSRSDSPRSTKDILTTQVDGILCTDGYLNYSESEHTLVYTYRYRNQFICLDTGLNVLFIGKTIDTTSVAKITVAEANGKITMSSPPFIVNMGTCVDGKYLFVHSNLVASNQSPDAIEDRSFIDVYNINDGSYLLSFYIYHVNDLKMRSFIVKDDALFAEFPGYVAKYNLALKHLTD